jgi:hypothetical protein
MNKAGVTANVITYTAVAAKITFDMIDGTEESQKAVGAAIRAAGYRTTPVRGGGFVATKTKTSEKVAA